MKSHGFTLIELLVVVAIVAILATVAVPNFGTLVSTNRMDTIQDRLVSALSQSRSEAIRQGIDVQLCQRSAITTNTTACGASWQNGWIVLAGSTGVRVEDPVNSSLTLSGSTVTFLSDGTTSAGSSTCFTVDDGDSATEVRYVQVSRFGRIKAWDGQVTNDDGDIICGT